MVNAQEYINEKYLKETTEIDISNKNLEGHLDLRDFTGLKSLICLGNKLTSLDLSKCNNLTKLNCSGNKFTDTDFLKEIPNKEKLEILRINNNKGLKENLNFLISFAWLKELSVEDCPLVGSLEPLKNMKSLKRVFISRTHISKGLEELPKDFRELYCDTYDYQYKSIKIVNELSKFSEGTYYDVARWREDKQNRTTSTVIPLERLYVIRTNIKKFINKWNKEIEDNWYERNKKRLIDCWRKQELSNKDNESELSGLQSPGELWGYRLTIHGTKFVSQASTVAGTALTLQEDGIKMGIGVLAIASFSELISWKLEEKLRTKEEKWNKFISDSTEFLDNYHELLGILEKIERKELGVINEVLNELRIKVKALLDEYDKEKDGKKNGIIDIDELTELAARKKLVNDLEREDKERGGGSQLGDIMIAMKNLEEEIIKYRQGTLEKKVEKVVAEEETQIVIDNQQDSEIQMQQEVIPKGSD